MCIYACVLFCHVLPPPLSLLRAGPASSQNHVCALPPPPWSVAYLRRSTYFFFYASANLLLSEHLAMSRFPLPWGGFHSWKLLRGPSSDPRKPRSYRQGVGSASPDFFVLVTYGDVSQQMLISLPVIPRGRQARPLAPETPLNTQNSFFSDSRSNRGRGGGKAVSTRGTRSTSLEFEFLIICRFWFLFLFFFFFVLFIH